MKLLMVFVDADRAPDLEELLESQPIHGFTEIPNVLGSGKTGKKLGTRAFPGSSDLYLIAIEVGDLNHLLKRLNKLRDSKGAAEGLRAFSIDIKEEL